MDQRTIPSLEEVTEATRRKFRLGWSAIALFILACTPFLPEIAAIPRWFLLLIPSSLVVAINAGRAFGPLGPAVGYGLCCAFMMVMSGILGDGFSTQPVTPYIVPLMAGALGGVTPAIIVGSAFLMGLFGLYGYHYLLGFVSMTAFTFWGFRLTSFIYLVYTEWTPIVERLQEAPLVGLKVVAEGNRMSDEMKQDTTDARNSLAAFSHEVRTPLNVIHTMADTLLQTGEPLNEQHSTLIRLLHSCAQNLLVISNNVLDVSAIWAGALTVRPGKFDVESVLNEWSNMVQDVTKRRQVQLSYGFFNETGDGTAKGFFDEGRVRQILHNVLDHILRTAKPDTHVSVVAKLSRTDTELRLFVTFNQLYRRMSPSDVQSQFLLPVTSFGDSSGTVEMGMYIARKLARALKGTLTCTCDNREGVMYSLDVPLGIVEDVDVSTLKLRILYADDEPTNQFVMKMLLKDTGHTLDTVDDGAAALEAVKMAPNPYDVVLLDLNMPIMGGLDCAMAIRSLEHVPTAQTPIAYMSAGEVEREHLEKTKVDHVLSKPCNKKQLLSFLEDIQQFYLRKIPSSSELVTATASRAPSATASRRESKQVETTHRHNTYWIIGASIVALAVLFGIRLLTFTRLLPVLLVLSPFMGYKPMSERQVGGRLFSLYVLTHTTSTLIILPLTFGGYDTFYPLASVAMFVSVALNRSTLLLAMTAFCHCLVGAGFLYFQYHEQYTPPVPPSEFGLATSLLFAWSTALVLFTGRCIYMEIVRSKTFSRLHEENEKLVNKHRKTLKLYKAMSELSSNVSYDIRTPLNVVLGITDRLKEAEDLPESMYQSVGVLDTAAGMLLLLLDNVVDAKRVESGGELVLQMTGRVNLRAFGKRITTMMAFYSRGKSVRLMLRVAENVPDAVYMDELRLQQVIVNLLTNSIKFTPSGVVCLTIALAHSSPDEKMVEWDALTGISPRLSIVELDRAASLSPNSSAERMGVPQLFTTTIQTRRRTGQEPAKEALIRFTISDTGVGMDKKAVQSLFRAYNAGVTYDTRKARGAGLGLYISQAIVQKAGGKMEVSSVLGQGSKFSFNLPLKVTHSSKTVPTTTPEARFARPLRILFAEDGPEMQYIVRLFLSDTPYQLDMAGTAKEALEMFHEQHYDVILLDQHLPDMNGPDVARKLRQMSDGDRVTIAAVTAEATEEAKSAAMSAGCNHFLAKPFSRVTLMSLLRNTATSCESTSPFSPRSPFSPNLERVSSFEGLKTLRSGGSFTAVSKHQSPLLALPALSFAPSSAFTSPKGSPRTSPTPDLHPVPPAKSQKSPLAVKNVNTEPADIVGVPSLLYDYLMDEWIPKLQFELAEMKTLVEMGNLKEMQETAHRIKGSAASFGLVQIGKICASLMSGESGQPLEDIEKCIYVLNHSQYVKIVDE